MSWHPQIPYGDLAPLPPGGVNLESHAVLKATVEARAALAALNQATALLPNPTVLLTATSLLEAQASSEIENIVTTTDALFTYEEDPTGAEPATKEALRYRSALFHGVRALDQRPINFNMCEQVCSEILNREMSVRTLSGTRIANPATRAVIYAPPEGAELIRDKLSAWEAFIHERAGLDPVIVMALAHYQFEAIHPFTDGNGRTGRIVNILMLIEAGLLSQPILYLSRYILKDKERYYSLLNGVTANSGWEPWLLFMIDAVHHTAASTNEKISATRTLQAEVAEAARATSGGRNLDFLDVLFEQPYCRIKQVMERCGVSRPTATSWLDQLVNADVLRTHRVGRDRLFVNHRFLDVLRRDEMTY